MTRTVIDSSLSSTSPTAGIQEAIDSLPPEGGLVEIPAGRYCIRHQIQPRPNVTLRGAGESTVIRRGPVRVIPLAETLRAGGNTVRVNDASELQPGDQIGIWSLRPPEPESWLYKGYNMRYLRIARMGPGGVIEGCKLFGKDAKEYRVEHGAQLATIFPAIFIHQADGVTIESLTLDGGFDGEPDGRDDANFMCAAVVQHEAKRCRILNVTVRRWNADGICVGGASSDTLISGCVCEHNWGIGLHPGGGIQSVRILGNVARYNEYGLLFCQGNRNVTVADNLIHHNRRHGIWGLGDPDRYCIVANNHCFNNGWHGIEAWKSVGNVLQGNICRNNSQAEPGKYAGLFLAEHRDNVITGNACLDDQEHPTQWRGIEARNASGDNIVADNIDRSYASR